MIKVNPNIFDGITAGLQKLKSEFAPVADFRVFPFELALSAKNIEYATDNLLCYMHDFLHACQRESTRMAMREAGVSGRR
jgi:hypothetical protein